MQQGCIKPLCDLLGCPDNKIIQVALDGLENILKVGEMDKQGSEDASDQNVNHFALFIEEAGGMEKIHDCQNNINEDIYMKAFNLIGTYFSDEEEAGDMTENPAPGQAGFGFNQQQQQPQQGGGFNFANGGDSMDM